MGSPTRSLDFISQARGGGTGLHIPRQTEHSYTCPVLLSAKDPPSQTRQAPKYKLIMPTSHSLFLGKSCCEIPGQNPQHHRTGGFAKWENAAVGKFLLTRGAGRSRKGTRPSQGSTVSVVLVSRASEGLHQLAPPACLLMAQGLTVLQEAAPGAPGRVIWALLEQPKECSLTQRQNDITQGPWWDHSFLRAAQPPELTISP